MRPNPISVHAHHTTSRPFLTSYLRYTVYKEEAEQLIERQIRRNIQYRLILRLILRQNTPHLVAPQGTPEALPYPILRHMSSPSQSHAAPRYALLRPLGRARPGWRRENAVYTPCSFPARARHVGLRPRTGQRDLPTKPHSLSAGMLAVTRQLDCFGGANSRA